MAKDPAFLFYYQDFLVGTSFLTLAERGAYITILCHMADKGPLTLEQIKEICLSYDNHMRTYEPTTALLGKLKINKKGLYFNQRLMDEVEKRRKYSNSRRLNRSHMNNISSHMRTYVPHMEDENDNSIVKSSIVSKEPIAIANTDHQQCVKYFCDKYEQAVGTKYVFQGDKDGKIMKNILKALPVSQFRTKVDQFFESSNPFIKEAGYSLGIFISQINKLHSRGAAESEVELIKQRAGLR